MSRVFTLLLAPLCLQRAAAQQTDLDVIASRAAASLLPPPASIAAFDAALARNLSFVTPNFTFSDINYTYCVNANWPAMLHPERARSFMAAYASPQSTYFRSAGLLATVHVLLGWWLPWNAAHRSTNWWMNQVGVPGYLAGTGLLLQAQGALLPSEAAGIAASTRGADTYRGGCEPTNCVWLAGNVFLGALLERNATTVARTVGDMYRTINVSNPFAPADPSGIKADGSFMMHGSLLYSGGYGMCYALAIINLLSWTRGTAFALPAGDARWDSFSHTLLDGSFRMMHFGAGLPPYGPAAWDVSALGRNYARPYGRDPASAAGQAVTWAPEAVRGVGGPRGAEFEAFAALLNGTGAAEGVDPSFLAFSFHFYEADYTAHVAPLPRQPPGGGPQVAHWSSSAFAASKRTRRSEITNAEGVASWHVAENAIWTMLNGTEFLDAPPAMSMAKLPGTTVLSWRQYTAADVGGNGATAFVGGASLGGGAASVAVNEFVAPNGAGLAYRKATLFTSNAVVALTANATAADPAAAVWTTVEQRRAGGGAGVSPGSAAPPPAPLGGVFTSAAGAAAPLPAAFNGSLPSDTWWVWEGGFGYLLLDRAPGQVTSGGGGGAPLPTLHASQLVQNGSWAALGVWPDFVACNIFTLWLEHPPPVAGAAAAYAVAPGVALGEWAGGLAAALAANITVVENSGALQAVAHGGDGVLAAAAYAEGGAAARGGGWDAHFSAPGAYVLAQRRRAGGGLALAAAQPAQVPWSATVAVAGRAPSRPAAPNCSAAPGGGLAFRLEAPPANGSSVVLEC